MFELVSLILAVAIVYILAKHGKKEEPSNRYNQMPDDAKLTYSEWESLDKNNTPLSATKNEWHELEKEEKITKEEYEDERDNFYSGE